MVLRTTTRFSMPSVASASPIGGLVKPVSPKQKIKRLKRTFKKAKARTIHRRKTVDIFSLLVCSSRLSGLIKASVVKTDAFDLKPAGRAWLQ